MDPKKIMVRSVSGIVYIAIIVGLLLCGSSGAYVLAAIFSVLATIEFDHISYHPGRKGIGIICCDIVANVSLVLIPSLIGVVAAPLWIIATLTRMTMELYAGEENPLKSLSTSLMSQVYIGVPLACMSLSAMLLNVSDLLANPSLEAFMSVFGFTTPVMPVLLMFIYLWLNDTGAFLVGSAMGRHKLFEKVSPKKTWEGFFGGFLFCAGASVLFYFFGGREFFQVDFKIGVWIGYAAVVALFATWGDLVESLIKRNLQLKDSGNIMPGHGGILDRIDSLLFVAPASLLYYLVCTYLPRVF